ncbi:MAG: GLPGLI family protein [Flavobacteriaceae bacterium]|nr:GLPGLI family protein [Flavobacteriaceae bacterium]
MKNKIFTIIYLILITNNLYCQNFGGKVEYSVNFEDDEKFNKGEFADFFKQAKDNSKYLNFILEFNKKEMNFYSEKVDLDGVNTSFSVAFSGSSGLYYKKSNDTKVLHLIDDPLLGKIILTDTTEIKWAFLNEIKIIQNFKCYKASTTIKFNNGVGDFQREVIAWYCPEIPYPYGPKGYSLPGLILELQDKNVVFGAKKITFYSEEKIINEPKGKIISLKEYNDKLTKHFEDEKENEK